MPTKTAKRKSLANNLQLAELLEKHGKTRSECAQMLNVETSTVDRWLVPAMKKRIKNTTYRAMPTSALILVKLWLGEMKLSDLPKSI